MKRKITIGLIIEDENGNSNMVNAVLAELDDNAVTSATLLIEEVIRRLQSENGVAQRPAQN